MRRHLPLLVIVGLIITLFWSPPSATTTPSPAPATNLHQAWQQAQKSGAFQYNTQLLQTTHPLPTLANVGLGPHQERIYIEGAINTHTEQFELDIWSRGGSTFLDQGAISMKLIDGQAWGRVNNNQWEPVDHTVVNLFAPGNDPLGFLHAARNIQLAPATDDRYTRYQFDIDGPAFAHYMRDQLEDDARQRGELPHGLRYQLLDTYLDMTGTGELWLDENGLPLRQIIDLNFPPTHNERLEAHIQTDFHAWGAIPTPQISLFNPLPLLMTINWPNTLGHLFILTLALLFLLLMLPANHSPRRYPLVGLTIIFLFLVTPLLQIYQVSAAYHRVSQRQQTQRQQTEQYQQEQELTTDQPTTNFNPTQNPLTSPAL
ncbi:MAG TPA: hypothetical protein VLL52_08850, partial [Anaerolineae bacterium]|nr:hypothetical protein [Anaerolineae bacterium]